MNARKKPVTELGQAESQLTEIGLGENGLERLDTIICKLETQMKKDMDQKTEHNPEQETPATANRAATSNLKSLFAKLNFFNKAKSQPLLHSESDVMQQRKRFG